jgi:hypothetical protein
MATAKIQIKIGTIEFSGEGEEAWLTAQLDKLFSQAANLQSMTSKPAPIGGSDGGMAQDTKVDSGGKVSLAAYLKEKNVGRNQVKRFLATAIWLSPIGNEMLTTNAVTKALSDNRQSPLKNPSDCLNKNVKKGNCVKKRRQFYVAPEGHASMA